MTRSSNRSCTVKTMFMDVLAHVRRGHEIDPELVFNAHPDFRGTDLNFWDPHRGIFQPSYVNRQVLPVDCPSRAGHDDEVDLPKKRGQLMPLGERFQGISTNQPTDLFPSALSKLAGGVDREARDGALQFDAVDFDGGHPGGCQFAHGKAIGSGCHIGSRLFEGWDGAGDQDEAVKAKEFRRRQPAKQVAVMNGVKRAAEAELSHGGSDTKRAVESEWYHYCYKLTSDCYCEI